MPRGIVIVTSVPRSCSAAAVTPIPPPAPTSFLEASAFNRHVESEGLGLVGLWGRQSLGKAHRRKVGKGSVAQVSHFQTSVLFHWSLQVAMLLVA